MPTLPEFLNLGGKLQTSMIRRTFESDGLLIAEITQDGSDDQYEIVALLRKGHSLERMFGHYQVMVATGQWPNRSGCGVEREGEDKKGKLLEVRLRFPDGRTISAARMVTIAAEQYTGIAASALYGTVTPKTVTPSLPAERLTLEDDQRGNGHFGQGWMG